MDYLSWFSFSAVVISLELWFRFRIRGHHKLNAAKGSKGLSDSFYLFDNFEQMESHPAYSKYELGGRTFFDELQASHKKMHISREESQDVVGAHINIIGGERITKRNDLEKGEDDVAEHWILLGGSTVLCLEVPDSMTWASCLQAIAIKSLNRAIQVHNFGRAGFKAVKVGALFPLFLSRYTKVTRITVYFGVNDAGWIAGSRPSNRMSYLGDGVLDLLSVASKLVAFLNLRMRSRRVRKASTQYAIKTMRKFLEYRDYFEERQVQIDFILQPNVFCKTHPSKFELGLIESAEPLRITGLHAAYETYLSHGVGLITPAIDTFSDTEETIFIDWCHVGVAGNSIIAGKLWNIKNDHLDSDIKTAAAMRVMKNHKDNALRSRNILKNKDETVYNYPLY